METVKRDYVYIQPAEDGIELFKGLKTFFEEYNHKKGFRALYEFRVTKQNQSFLIANFSQ